MRAAIDTQVWVRAFLDIRRTAGRVARAFYDQSFVLLVSQPLLDEIADVLSRPRVARKHRRTPEEIADYIDGLRDGGEMIAVEGSVHVCRDPDDDFLIETAERGGADCLVTEDQDLQAPEVREYLASRGIRVLNILEFLRMLEEEWSVRHIESQALRKRRHAVGVVQSARSHGQSQSDRQGDTRLVPQFQLPLCYSQISNASMPVGWRSTELAEDSEHETIAGVPARVGPAALLNSQRSRYERRQVGLSLQTRIWPGSVPRCATSTGPTDLPDSKASDFPANEPGRVAISA